MGLQLPGSGVQLALGAYQFCKNIIFIDFRHIFVPVRVTVAQINLNTILLTVFFLFINILSQDRDLSHY